MAVSAYYFFSLGARLHPAPFAQRVVFRNSHGPSPALGRGLHWRRTLDLRSLPFVERCCRSWQRTRGISALGEAHSRGRGRFCLWRLEPIVFPPRRAAVGCSGGRVGGSLLVTRNDRQVWLFRIFGQ
jgi:hypothetical protein